jgi:AraC-like DNA-binding protein
MRYWLVRPDARLRREVRCYFVVEADARRACKEELHLPDGYAEVVFNLGASFDRNALGEPIPCGEMTSSYVIGARSHSVLTRDLGNVKVIGVKLEPRMLHHLIRTPLAELRDSTVTLHDLNDRALLMLERMLADCASVEDIVGVLDDFFLRQQQSRGAPHEPVIEQCVERIRDTHGAMSLTDWTRERRIDPRTLQRKFASGIGMTPKTYARIVRFKHAYHRLITQCARDARADDYLAGYYDQSHFYKEFRYFTGTSPLALIAARTPASMAVTDHLLTGDLSAA